MIGPRMGARGAKSYRAPTRSGLTQRSKQESSNRRRGETIGAGGVESANKLERSRLTIFDESVK